MVSDFYSAGWLLAEDGAAAVERGACPSSQVNVPTQLAPGWAAEASTEGSGEAGTQPSGAQQAEQREGEACPTGLEEVRARAARRAWRESASNGLRLS